MNVSAGVRHLMRAPTHLLMGLVQGYRYLLSPWLGSNCRFTPTCSAYALEALQAHGATVGTYLAARRIVRCRPGCPGGHDPVPKAGTHLFSRVLTAAEASAPVEASNPGSSAP